MQSERKHPEDQRTGKVSNEAEDDVEGDGWEEWVYLE